MNRRILAGLATVVFLFLIIRIVDGFVMHRVIIGYDIRTFVASGVRLVLAVFASVAVGAFVARRGLLVPILVLVSVVWTAGLANTYAHRDDYFTTLRIIDLDWPGAIMAIVATIYAVRAGEWVARSAGKIDEAET